MSTKLSEIKQLLINLPEKDIPIGEKLVENRDFESLKELVDSALIKVLKSRKRNASTALYEKYKNVDTEALTELSSDVSDYIGYLY